MVFYTPFSCVKRTSILLTCLLLLVRTSLAVDLAFEQELIGYDVAPSDDNWASAVAIDGNLAIVGAAKDDVNRTSLEPGSVFVFGKDMETSMWSQLQQLFGSETESGDEFGRSVALHENLLIVGAPISDEAGSYSAGSVYIFERNDGGIFEEKQRLVSPDGGRVDGHFGESVSVSGDWLLVGEPNDSYSYSRAGMAHLYRREGGTGMWVLMQTLETPKPLAGETATSNLGDTFGESVDIDGNSAVIGSPGKDMAYVFVRRATTDAWEIDARLESTESIPDQFGDWVAIDGDKLIVNTYDYGENLHVYHRDSNNQTWTLHSVLNSGSFGCSIAGDLIVTNFDVWMYSDVGDEWSMIADIDYAGNVDISGNQIIAGDSSTDAFIYMLPSGTWAETQELIPSLAINDNYGDAIDIDKVNDNMVICDSEGYSTYDLGVAYLYERVEGGGWIDVQQLEADASGIGFCNGAAIDEKWLAIAADDEVFVYEDMGGFSWALAQELTLPFGLIDSSCYSCEFGTVELSGNTIVVANEGGFAHVFSYDGTIWAYAQTIYAPDADKEQGFGEGPVAVDDELGVILIAADTESSNGDAAGSVYEFVRDANNEWNFASKVVPTRETPGAQFGTSVAFSSGVAVIAGGLSHDYAYIFSWNETGWTNDQVLETFGNQMAISGDGRRIASKDNSYTRLSNGTWVKENSVGSYNYQNVALSASGDALVVPDYGTSADVYQLVEIIPMPETDGPESDESISNGDAAGEEVANEATTEDVNDEEGTEEEGADEVPDGESANDAVTLVGGGSQETDEQFKSHWRRGIDFSFP